MNTRYFLRVIIIYSIPFIVCTGFKSINRVYPGKIKNTNRLILSDTTNPIPGFLVISDIHLNSSVSQKESNGDTGDSLWKLVKKEINRIITLKKPKFIIVLGDLPRHDTSTKMDSTSVRQNTAQVIKYFKDSAKIPHEIPLIYVPGNNDSWNGDYSAFTMPDYIYKVYGYPFLHVDSHTASHHACVDNDSLLKNMGCFSVYPLGKKNKLKLIVLNTVIFTRNRNFPYSSDTLQQALDAGGMLNWFSSELEKAGKNDEKVLIAMHVTPGVDGYSGKNMWYDKNLQNKFLNAIAQYQNNIIGLLASHTHMDGIRLMMDSDNNINSLLISIPGVSPGHGNNPAIKLIEYNPGTFALQNFITYYMNYWNKCLDQRSENCDERLTTWNRWFSFRSKANYYGNLSMLQYFQKKRKENKEGDIDQFVNGIYSVYGKKQDASKIDATIYVSY